MKNKKITSKTKPNLRKHEQAKVDSLSSSTNSIRAEMFAASKSKSKTSSSQEAPRQKLIASLLRRHITDQALDEKIILAALKKLIGE